MGFFDKIKGAVNAVTGGGAKVLIEYQPAVGFPGDWVRVRISAQSTGGEIKSKGVFVDLLGTEQVRLREGEAGEHGHINGSKQTFAQEFQIAPAFVLAPNETKQWEGQFQLPAALQPSYQGAWAQHVWQVRGRIEAFGNDPDSGFQPFRVGLRG